MITAADLMTESPVAIPVTATVRRAISTLEELDIRHLPVVDESGNLVGMLSDRDIRGLSIPYVGGGEKLGEGRTSLDAPVASLMSANVLSVDVEADASEAVELMLEYKIGAVPVVDGDGSLVGIISYIDVLRALPLEAQQASATKE